MNEILADLVADVQSRRKLPYRDDATEEQVKQSVIEPVLDALGWTTSSIEEVEREYTVEGVGDVDYVLRLKGENKVFLEAKRSRARLVDHATQLRDYVAEEAVPLAVLTNGLAWWFYLPLRKGSWGSKRVCTIDLLREDIPSIVGQLTRFLSKENIESGEAVRNADIHRAWQVLISPDDRLVNLLGKKIEEMGGGQPDPDQIKRFLASVSKPSTEPPIRTLPPTPSQFDMQAPATQYRRKNKSPSPESITFLGERFEVRYWSEVMVRLGETVYKRHVTEFSKVGRLGGWHPVGQSSRNNRPKPIADSGWIVNTNRPATEIVSMCDQLLNLFNYSPDDLHIETR